AARMHYHSNFAETRGFVDHSARVMQAITWNRSFKGIPPPENVKNELADDEWETHATVLDKLLAWEKKLCHEVKEFEVIKVTYQRKLAVLNKKKQSGASSSSVEKTKSIVSHLHTKYIVDLQTMESTIAEIDRLRDQQLYPKLLELVKGFAHMWDVILKRPISRSGIWMIEFLYAGFEFWLITILFQISRAFIGSDPDIFAANLILANISCAWLANELTLQLDDICELVRALHLEHIISR
ncbi:hypothetical protein ACJX0J_030388, partial [Zea mays]